MTENDEFSAAFAEASKPETEQTPEAPAAAPQEAAPESQPETQAAEPAPPQESDAERLARELEAALHRERSVAHRISAVDKRNNELTRQVESLMAQIEQLRQPKQQPAQAAPATPDVLDEAPELKQAVERRLAERLDPLLKRVDEVDKRAGQATELASRANQVIEPISQREQRSTVEATWQELDKRFTPAWRDEVRSDKFRAWIEAQPTPVRQLYQGAMTPDESAKVLHLYAAETGVQFKAPTAKPAATTNTDRLREAAGVPTRGRSTSPGDQDDFSAAFRRSMREFAQQQANNF